MLIKLFARFSCNLSKEILIKSYLYLLNVAVFRIIFAFLPILNIRSSTRHLPQLMVSDILSNPGLMAIVYFTPLSI